MQLMRRSLLIVRHLCVHTNAFQMHMAPGLVPLLLDVCEASGGFVWGGGRGRLSLLLLDVCVYVGGVICWSSCVCVGGICWSSCVSEE